MDIVLLMPGQGSQKVGMGRDLADAFPEALAAFATVDEAIGAPLSELMFAGPADELTRTSNAQPALLAHSAALWSVVKNALGSRVRAAAGHSLGEFSAYHAVGALSLADAARVVRTRGLLMLEQGALRPGTMAAVIGLLTRTIDDICKQASAESALVVPANFNTAEQVVISGEVAGVERAMQLAREAGAKRCLLLPVSGAFHSPLMAPAAKGLSDALDAARMSDNSIPVFANVDATVVRDAETARRLLVEQLTAPVKWTLVMQRLAEAYPDALFVELGTGSVLCGLAKRVAPNVSTVACGTVAEVEALLKQAA